MTIQVHTNKAPQAVSRPSEDHTVRDVAAGGVAGYLGLIGSLELLMKFDEKITSVFGKNAATLLLLVVAAVPVGITAWVLSRNKQRQAENDAPSLQSRKISPLVSSPKVRPKLSSFK